MEALWCLGLVAAASQVVLSENFTLSCVSWNVNSVAKIRDNPRAIGHLTNADVVFLQETLHTRVEDCLVLNGFVGQHNLAIPTARRPSRGLSSFFKIESFTDGGITQVILSSQSCLSRRETEVLSDLVFITAMVMGSLKSE